MEDSRLSVLTPTQLASPGTEHAHQTAFFCALSSPQLYLTDFPEAVWEVFKLAHAIPSGGARDVVTAGRLKAEGVRPGVPDVCIPVARRNYHALYLEFKKLDRVNSLRGGLSEAQTHFKDLLERHGNCVVPTYGWEHGISILRWYLL